MNPDPNITIPHAIKATVNLLKTASQQAIVKRIVLTSSSTAAYLPKPNEEGIVLTTGAEALCYLRSFRTPALTKF